MKTSMEKSVSSYWLAPGKPQVAVVDSPAAAGKTTPEDFMEFVIEYFKLDPQVFRSNKSNRRPAFVNVKHMVRHYLRFHYGISFEMIGQLTCRADHSTAIHSCNTHKDFLKSDFEYREAYKAFQKEARAREFHGREVAHV